MIPIYRPDNLDEYLDEVMLIMIMMMVIIMMLVIIIMNDGDDHDHNHVALVGNICIYEWSMV